MYPKKPRILNRALLDLIKEEPCIACKMWPTDPAHIKTRGSGGPDTIWNVIPLCRNCHRFQTDRGWIEFLEAYPILWVYLQTIGWEWLDGKLWNDRLAGREC